MSQAAKILVFRLGSIGDFVISMPSFQLIRQRYPAAEIVLLTNEPENSRIVPADSILQGTGLVDRYLKYPGGTRDPHELRLLKQEIRAYAPDLMIYLAAPRGLLATYRDFLFFRWCGITRIVGLPGTPDRADSRPPAKGSALWEREAERLARQLLPLGPVDFSLQASRALNLSAEEIGEAARLLDRSFPDHGAGQARRVFGLSIGTNQPINDWGDANWRAVLEELRRLDFGLVLLGGKEDRLRSRQLVENWPGPVLNLCGEASVRMSGAVLKHLRLLLCHDSGPMHIAAAVGTRCVAVFSRRNPPGKWFPLGAGHKVLYPLARAASIRSIAPRQVIAAAVDALGTAETGLAPLPQRAG